MISSVRPATAPRPVAAAPAAAAKATAPTTPVAAPRPVKAVQAPAAEWTVGRALKTAGAATAGFVGGSVGTFVVDLFFHFGNNGGTAFPGGIYLVAAGAVALGAAALYAKLSDK